MHRILGHPIIFASISTQFIDWHKLMKLFAIVSTLFFSVMSFAGRCPYCNLEIPDEIIDAHVLDHQEDVDSNDSDDGKQEIESRKRKYDTRNLTDVVVTQKKRCLEENRVMNSLDKKLIEAAQNWDVQGVATCLDSHANVNAKNKQGSVLFQVISSLNDAKVQFDMENDDDQPEGHAIDIIWQLLRSGANVTDAIFEQGESDDNQGLISSLCECIDWHEEYETGFDEELQQVLDKIIAMINVNHANSHGVTPLAILVETGYFAGMKTLVDNGAKVNAIDKSGVSILKISLNGNSTPDMPRFLVERGAFVEASDLMLAIKRRQASLHMQGIDPSECQYWAELVTLMWSKQTKHFMLTKLAIQGDGINDVPPELHLFIFSKMIGL